MDRTPLGFDPSGHLDPIGANQTPAEFNYPFILEIDNEAARIFANNSASKSKLKHIDCRQEWVQTLRNSKIVKFAHVDTKDNIADLFTKILPKDTFILLRDQCMTTCARKPTACK